MKIFFTHIVLTFLLWGNHVQAQQGGYFGKKSLIDVSFSGYPMRWNTMSGATDKEYHFYPGYKINYSFLASSTVAVSFSIQTFKAIDTKNYDSFEENMANYGYVSYDIMMRGYDFGISFEKSMSDINQRTGWYYRLGLSFLTTTNYGFENVETNWSASSVVRPSDEMPSIRNYNLKQRYGTAGFLWELGNRFPLSHSLLFHYSANGYLYKELLNNEYDENNSVLISMKRKSAFGNLVFLNLGLSLAF